MMLFNSSKTKSSAIRGIFCASLLCVVNIANAISTNGMVFDPAIFADLLPAIPETQELLPYAGGGMNPAYFMPLGAESLLV